LSRSHGVTCDNLLEAEIVTADGRVVRASERENPDLYWATRGGAGGSFGVITRLTFRLVPVDMPFTYAAVTFPWDAAVDILEEWQLWLAALPENTHSDIELATQDPAGGAQPEITVEVTHAGEPRDVRLAIGDLADATGHQPTHMDVISGPFVEVERDQYCKGLRPKECTVEGKTPAGEFPRLALYSKSDFAREPWPRDGLSALAEWIERRQRDRTLTPRGVSATHMLGKVLIEAADGETNALAPGATAFVHRDNLWFAQFQSRWPNDSPADVVDANLEWTDDFYAAVEPWRSGFAYQNYPDARLEDWQHAYYGQNLARLREVKSRYDPDNLFSFAQSVPLAEGSG
jgi:FAD/FMN-containing dehydrogenase